MEAEVPVDASFFHPSLPEGVAKCEGFSHPSWITKCVTLINDEGMDVGNGICHSVSADLVVDSDGTPLGNDRVAIQIAKSIREEDVTSEWMFSLRAWHITKVVFNGATLYDHDQQFIYNSTVAAFRRQPLNGC